MAPDLQNIINTAQHAMHFAGKLEGTVLCLIGTPGNLHGSHAVLIFTPTQLHQLPTMPEDQARAAFWQVARKLLAA